MSCQSVLRLAVAVSFIASTGWAADPAVKCETSQLKETGKYANCRLKAEAKGVQKNEAPDYMKCEEKFSDKWGKIETKAGPGTCSSEGDEAEIDSRTTSYAADMATILAGGTLASCGNGVIDAGEDCDFAPGGLGGETCITQGQIFGGLLQCGANCEFDYSGCTGANYVFVTSTHYDGDLGGVAGADAKCQARAVAAGLPGTYKAWISDSTSSPSTTFTQSPSAYVLVDLTQVAASWAALTGNGINCLTCLDAPIDRDEFGVAVVSPPQRVWTGTAADGTALGLDSYCSDWMSNDSGDQSLFLGDITAVSRNWTRSGSSADCDFARRLYCFQQ